jgi:hypothetical protein
MTWPLRTHAARSPHLQHFQAEGFRKVPEKSVGKPSLSVASTDHLLGFSALKIQTMCSSETSDYHCSLTVVHWAFFFVDPWACIGFCFLLPRWWFESCCLWKSSFVIFACYCSECGVHTWRRPTQFSVTLYLETQHTQFNTKFAACSTVVHIQLRNGAVYVLRPELTVGMHT